MNIAQTTETTVRPPNERMQVGEDGERAARVFLIDQGYRILDQNWRVPALGELDIVAVKRGLVVFIEVKTRRWLAPDAALAVVDEQRLLRIKKLAVCWLTSNQDLRPCRFDLIGVQLRPGRAPLFEWLKDVGQ